MYCSSCGAALPPGLSFCNRCGAELTAKEAKPAKTLEFSESLVWAIVAVSTGGISVLIGMMAVMKAYLNFNTQSIAFFSLLGFLLLLGAESAFIWMLLRSRKAQSSGVTGTKEAGYPTQLHGSVARELDEGQSPFEPAMSVTEHTTHNLEPVYRERKAE